MFGYVTARASDLSPERQKRYTGVYCGICRALRRDGSRIAGLGLSYDMAFLALLLMSLYEPEEQQGKRACGLHPLQPKPWVDNEYIRYAASMNIVLAYYKGLDDWRDDRSYAGRFMARRMEPLVTPLQEQYPRQCEAVARCIADLTALEEAGHTGIDEPANCFGQLMGELLCVREDHWAPILRKMGFYLGRFIYLVDALMDYPRDIKKKKYNPLIGQSEPKNGWEEYLVLAMGECTRWFEQLPLVQDKDILDNILYSGVWCRVRKTKKEMREPK